MAKPKLTFDLAQVLNWLKDAKSGTELANHVLPSTSETSAPAITKLCDVLYALNGEKVGAELEVERLKGEVAGLEKRDAPCANCAMVKPAETVAAKTAQETLKAVGEQVLKAQEGFKAAQVVGQVFSSREARDGDGLPKRRGVQP